MVAVANALLPVFLIIACGVVLKRTLLPADEAWLGLERLTYFVLFPALLVVTTATADLKDVPAGGVAAALFLAVITLSAALFAGRVPLTRALALTGPAYSSVFQGATRWNTYVALATASALYGNAGLALVSVAIVAMIPVLNVINVWIIAHYAADAPPGAKIVIGHMLRNPFIWSSLLGIAINVAGVPLPKVIVTFGEILGRASLALGLLLVGAGLVLGDIVKPDARVYVTAALKLLVMPAIAIGIGIVLGLSGEALAVVAIASSVPSAPNSYVLARQLGGDAPLLARILTFETLIALATIPLALALAALRP
ncbi:MAG TPA: AEC family transporter [Xanthobacteraceae bacterium]|nr:AEC family transporter [Xanthobacteraceae bacterium]